MNRLLPVLHLVFLTGVFFVLSAGSAQASTPGLRENVVTGNTAFATGLYGELSAGTGNLFFSPYSVSSAMGMTYTGARGNTAREMKEVLHFRADQRNLGGAFKRLNSELAASARRNGQKLNIANALVLTGGNVSSEFGTQLKNNYDAEIFNGGLESVNAWVSQKTEGKIGKILEELSADSVCVLLNAIYFKGSWESQFEKSSTRPAPFMRSMDSRASVPFMYQKGRFKLLTGPDFSAVSIPYQGNNLSMVILLPQAADGLAVLEKQLTAPGLKEWLAKLDKVRAEEIELHVPKFRLETGFDLKPAFLKMGMKDAFHSAADFNGFGWPKGKLWISQVRHKAFVEVNEEGTEAAAATAVEMVTKSVRYTPVFRADHPFLFIIRDRKSETILFMGRIYDPRSS
ncbi:MAG: serpin family protein [Gallionella sp.]|nr:serpin family protein [Gallionella sp.]